MIRPHLELMAWLGACQKGDDEVWLRAYAFEGVEKGEGGGGMTRSLNCDFDDLMIIEMIKECIHINSFYMLAFDIQSYVCSA